MTLTSYSYAVLLLTVLIQAFLTLQMAKTRTYRQFPAFFLYTAFVLLFQVGGYLVLSQAPFIAYFYFFWICNALSVILGFVVIREVFQSVLNRYEGILGLWRILFRWAIVVLMVVAVFAALASPGNEASRLSVGVLTFERTVRIVQCGLLLFLFLFARTLGLSWRHHSFGIAFGFALFAAVSVIVYGVRVHIGPDAADTVHYLVPASYLLACMVWAIYLLAPAPAALRLTLQPSSDLHRWNDAVLELLRR